MMKIPITKPYFTRKEEQLVSKVIKSGWVAQGPIVGKFERLFCEFISTSFSCATNSCTTALHLSLVAAGIKEKDEVILPSFTHPATINVVLYLNAKPVLVDIDLKTYNIDVNQIKKKISSKTKAIIPVHLFGLPANLKEICKIAKKHRLVVIEDAACAIGAEYDGKKIGSFDSLACFSFHPRKIITTGEGGMITTNNQGVYNLLRILRSHGSNISDLIYHKTKRIIFPEFVRLGFNYRMTDIQAAIGVAQMEKLPEIIKKRRQVAKYYNEKLANIDFIVLPYEPKGYKHVYQTYVIRIKENSKLNRDKIMYKLMKKGISTRKGTNAIHNEYYYKKRFNYSSKEFPNSLIADKTTIALPLFHTMTKEEQNYIVKTLLEMVVR